MTPEVPNAANFNMAAKSDQQRRADANEVMLEKRASRWGSDEVISRDRSQPPLGPEASTEGAEGLRGGGAEEGAGVGREPVEESACCRLRKRSSDAGRLRRGIGVGGFGESAGYAAPGLVAEGGGDVGQCEIRCC